MDRDAQNVRIVSEDFVHVEKVTMETDIINANVSIKLCKEKFHDRHNVHLYLQ